MKLVTQDDTQETKVFTTHIKSSAGKQQQFRIVIEGGPRFYLEPSGEEGSYFLSSSRNNKLIGLLDRDGVLHKSTNKLFYLNKLNLTRRIMSPSSSHDENLTKDKDKQDNSDTHISSNYKFIENEDIYTNSKATTTTTTTTTATTSPPQTHVEEVIVIDDDDDDDHMVNNDNGDSEDNELKSLNFQKSALFC